LAKKLWTLRWSLLRSQQFIGGDKQAIAELESEDDVLCTASAYYPAAGEYL